VKFALLFAVSTLPLLSGCYREQPASGSIHLDEIPEKVAVLTIQEGFAIDFGSVPPGETGEAILTIENTGPYPATEFKQTTEPETPFSFKDGSFPGTGGSCTDRIEPDATCTLVITYEPDQLGSSEKTIEMSYVNGVLEFPLHFVVLGTSE